MHPHLRKCIKEGSCTFEITGPNFHFGQWVFECPNGEHLLCQTCMQKCPHECPCEVEGEWMESWLTECYCDCIICTSDEPNKRQKLE
jgi:hypothetical protein